jgi:hypothetical protein
VSAGPAGGELEAGEDVDEAEAAGDDAADVTDDDGADPGGLQPRPDVAAQPSHVVPADERGQHQYGGCLGVHGR